MECSPFCRGVRFPPAAGPPQKFALQSFVGKRRNDEMVWEKPSRMAGLFEWNVVHSDVVTRGRIELPFAAWEAAVLTAWPTGHIWQLHHYTPGYTVCQQIFENFLKFFAGFFLPLYNTLKSSGFSLAPAAKKQCTHSKDAGMHSNIFIIAPNPRIFQCNKYTNNTS